MKSFGLPEAKPATLEPTLEKFCARTGYVEGPAWTKTSPCHLN